MSDDRLRKLLLMLSSPYDGEIVTAAKAIGSLLEKDGSDWHTLADRCAGRPQPRAAEAKPQPQPAEADAFEDHQAAAEWLSANYGSRLREKDREFLETMMSWSGWPSEKQAKWLNDLCRRFGYRP